MSSITRLGGGGGGSSGIETQDEGVTAGTAQTVVNFIGAGVTVASVGAVSTVTIPGGGGGGSGDVVGPGSATDNAISRFDTTTGKLLQNSLATIDDSGNIATPGTVDGRDVSVDGTKLDGIASGATANAASAATPQPIGTAAAGSNAPYAREDHVHAISAGTVTLAQMANLAQDQFIGRTTASTGVPQTATITAAARTVLDDTTVAAMVDTLGGASSSGTGGLARVTSPAFTTPNIGNATGNISGNAATVTTNANLTGPITSVGNATTIADAELAAIAGLTSAADQAPYFTGSGTASLMAVTAAARTVLDDTTVAAMLATLGGLGGALGGTDNQLMRTDGTSGKTAQGSGITVDDSQGIAGHTAVINAQVGTTYTVQQSDTGKHLVLTNGSAITVTIPASITAGFQCTWEQGGAGQVAFNGTAVTAATLGNRQSHTKAAGQHAMGSLSFKSTGVCTLAGDTAT